MDLSTDPLGNDKPDNAEMKSSAEEMHNFKYESDDLSFTLDHQEKRLTCQLKVSSLEGFCSLIKSTQDPTSDYNGMYKKTFSSSCTILDEQLLQKVEAINGGGTRSPVWDRERPISNLTLPRGSFVVLDIKSYSEPHRPLEVKLNVQMFEGVVSVPLARAVLDILQVIIVKSERNEQNRNVVNSWPLMEISLDSFRVLFPCLSPSSGFLADFGGIFVKSELPYTIDRMEVNSTALRKLSIMAAEKRIPPLPGYEVQVFTLQLLGVNVDRKRLSQLNASVFPILMTAGVQVLYSPALQWASLLNEKVDLHCTH